jgi:hypothetical protein
MLGETKNKYTRLGNSLDSNSSPLWHFLYGQCFLFWVCIILSYFTRDSLILCILLHSPTFSDIRGHYSTHTGLSVVFFCFFFLVFRDRVSLCSPGCPGTHFVEQAGFELRNLPASASWVLGLKVCATTPCCQLIILKVGQLVPLKDQQLLCPAYGQPKWSVTVLDNIFEYTFRSIINIMVCFWDWGMLICVFHAVTNHIPINSWLFWPHMALIFLSVLWPYTLNPPWTWFSLR